jgi:uncharacterized membrane protein
MTERIKIKKIVLAGLFTALGLVIPFFAGHSFGMRGTVLLPMHLPVLLCGLICGPKLGFICGFITPFLSSVMTGMPSAFPMLPVLACELSLYGIIVGWTYRIKKMSIYPSLICSITAGRIANGLVLASLLSIEGGTFKILSAVYSVLTGLPGVIIQLITVPIILKYIEGKINAETIEFTVDKLNIPDDSLAEARSLIASGKAGCVTINKGIITDIEDGAGISPLMDLYVEKGNRLKGTFVVDRVIGKAAAVICVCAGARGVFGELMSKPAAVYLKERNIPRSWTELTENIINRQKDGICPMEFSVLGEDDPEKGFKKICATLEKINSNNS